MRIERGDKVIATEDTPDILKAVEGEIIDIFETHTGERHYTVLWFILNKPTHAITYSSDVMFEVKNA